MARQYNEVDRLTDLRPNPSLSQGIYWDGSQRTTFHSWQNSFYQRLTRDFSANVNYTWGSAMAHTGGDISPGFIGDSTANVQDFFDIDAVGTRDVATSRITSSRMRPITLRRSGSRPAWPGIFSAAGTSRQSFALVAGRP